MSTPHAERADGVAGTPDFKGDAAMDPDVLRRRRERVLTFLAVFVILGAAGFVAHHLFGAPPPTHAMLAEAAQRAIKARTGPTAILQFPGVEEMVVRHAGDARYAVSGYFKIIGGDGREEQQFRFDCLLERQSRGRLEPLELSIRLGY